MLRGCAALHGAPTKVLLWWGTPCQPASPGDHGRCRLWVRTLTNFAEVASFYAKRGSSRAEINALLGPLPIDLVSADRTLAMDAAMLRPLTVEVGLSLGDRFCLALARREGLPAWTADQAWRNIGPRIGVDIVLIR